MNLIAVGRLSSLVEGQTKEAGMRKEALGGLGAAAAIAGLALAYPTSRYVISPAFNWAKRNTVGLSPQAKARRKMMRARTQGYREMGKLPYTLGGAGIGGALGYGLSGGSGWGTSLGALGGGYLGRRYGKGIYDWIKSQWGSQEGE